MGANERGPRERRRSRDSVLSSLRERAARIPRRPGAYLFQDARGKVLYVGKAKNLRHRVVSYFHAGRDHDPKTLLLLRSASALDFIVTDSEAEALLLELNLIKEHRPRYNIRLRDDKKYPFIKITVNEPVPRAIVTRRVVADGAKYFGPYTDAAAMRRTLRALQRVFGIRGCPLRLPRQRRSRACLDYYIGRCLGPCVPHVSEEDYARAVEGMVRFLEGREDALERELDGRMKSLAADRRYEDAARVRDQIRSLSHVRVRQKVASDDGEARDVVAVVGAPGRAAGVVLRVRNGRLVGQDYFALTPGIERSGPDMTSAFLKEYYGLAPGVPREVLVNDRPPDADALQAWLGGLRGGKVDLVRPQRGDKAALVRLARENAELRLRDATGDAMPDQAALEELQEAIGLGTLPRRLECIDISTSHGRESVGSVVVFVDGRPAKGEYRHFKVHYRGDGGEADDFAMMGEVVERRYRRMRDEGRPLPDLVVIDGGRGQLGVARRTLDALGLATVPAIALAKREEEIYFQDRPEPLALQPDSAALKQLVRLRNEAHRFAVTFHRALRGKRVRGSRLDRIPGLGPARKEALVRAMGSVARIRDASLDELTSVAGIGPRLAREIQRALREEDGEMAVTGAGEAG